jgi:hypothetical protein
MRKQSSTIAAACILSLAILILGYLLLGIWPTFLFAFGFMGGLIIWFTVSVHPPFASIKVPYFLTLGFFVLHKWEERYQDFFPELSKITGVPVPDTNSIGVYMLYLAAGAWLLIPWLVAKRYEFGYYLAWTFFTSMGVIELAHFVFPFFTNKSYGYFPGMATVIVLAPAAWWGMYRLSRKC